MARSSAEKWHATTLRRPNSVQWTGLEGRSLFCPLLFGRPSRPLHVAQPARAESGAAQSVALRWPAAGQTWRFLGYLLMAIAVVLVGLPMYWMLIAAFKTNQEIFTSPPTWLPLA